MQSTWETCQLCHTHAGEYDQEAWPRCAEGTVLDRADLLTLSWETARRDYPLLDVCTKHLISCEPEAAIYCMQLLEELFHLVSITNDPRDSDAMSAMKITFKHCSEGIISSSRIAGVSTRWPDTAHMFPSLLWHIIPSHLTMSVCIVTSFLCCLNMQSRMPGLRTQTFLWTWLWMLAMPESTWRGELSSLCNKVTPWLWLHQHHTSWYLCSNDTMGVSLPPHPIPQFRQATQCL